MDISFKTKKLGKIFNNQSKLVKEYGALANKIMIRMGVLQSVPSLHYVPTKPPDRCHALSGEREGQFAVDLKHPFRLIFSPNHDPLPLLEEGGIDLSKITAITIIEVPDYH